MTALDPSTFGGKLAEAIATYHRLVAEADDAREGVEAAERELQAAKADDLNAAVTSKVFGQEPPKDSLEEAAETVLKTARWDAEVASRSVLAALDAMASECQNPRYAKALGKRKVELTQAATAALDALDSLLVDLEGAKAHAAWLASPVQGNRLAQVTAYDVWITKQGFTKPNGEPAEAQTLTAVVREALQGPGEPENPAAEYGFPVGQLMSGPFTGTVEPVSGYAERLSGGAIRAFQEQIDEAEEAQAVLAS
jgi:hypothetical protein